MENLTDAGNRPKRSGLARLKRIRDEMFKKKHQTLKEEDAKEGNVFNQFFTSMLGPKVGQWMTSVRICLLNPSILIFFSPRT